MCGVDTRMDSMNPCAGGAGKGVDNRLDGGQNSYVDLLGEMLTPELMDDKTFKIFFMITCVGKGSKPE